MRNDTILERIDQEFKIGDIDSLSFKKSIDDKKHSNLLNFSREQEYTYYKSDDETYFEYAIFKLYCFFDYSIKDIYKLLSDLGSKYYKSTWFLSYSDFLEFTKVFHFVERKKDYYENSDEYRNKVKMNEDFLSDNLENLRNDYEDTSIIINCLNEDMKDICNDEDISAEKRIDVINKYSKISLRLDEKRSILFKNIKQNMDEGL